jgi:hypothetical protein
MKHALIGGALVVVITGAGYAITGNTGTDWDGTPSPPVYTTGDGPAILYAPSEADDPEWRASITAIVGGLCDYYDARSGTPTLDLLLHYSCVHVWANFAFADADAYGDNLARYVDAGGTVIMGAFCTYTTGNALGGAIMTEEYSPVRGGSNHFSYAEYSGDGTSCTTDGVGGFGATYRDILTLQGDGRTTGTFTDGEIAIAEKPDRSVVYANGSAGRQLPDGWAPDWPSVVANPCGCAVPLPVEEGSWGQLKERF